MIRSRSAEAKGRLLLTRRLTVLVAASAAALTTTLAGCEAGNNAPTLQFHAPTDGTGWPAGTKVGPLFVRNLFVLGAPLGQNLARGQSASVFLALINNGVPDRLVSISAFGTATTVTLPAGGIPVVAGHPVYYSGPLPRVVLQDLTRPLRGGSTVRLVLHFQQAGPVSLEVPVMPRAAQYATFAPPPAAPSPAAKATPAGPGAASPSVTPSPSAS
ncbi:MAG: hypothetical protein J2P29_07610 [Actinobacteria bacterium]|nr:hypothetical protein [Actinomycetota bacterium]